MRTCILPGNASQQGNLHPTMAYLSAWGTASFQRWYPSMGTYILPVNTTQQGNLHTAREYIPAGQPASYQGIHPGRGTPKDNLTVPGEPASCQDIPPSRGTYLITGYTSQQEHLYPTNRVYLPAGRPAH